MSRSLCKQLQVHITRIATKKVECVNGVFVSEHVHRLINNEGDTCVLSWTSPETESLNRTEIAPFFTNTRDLEF